jgi:transcriptional regulator with XRE-family HTH domain
MSLRRSPTPDPADSNEVAPGLGKALKAARLARGESLAQVAAATGISKSSLSLIENDRSDVTLRRLVILAKHYGKHLSDLLPGNPTPDPVVTRRRERRQLHSRVEGLDLHLLVPDTNRKMMPLVAVFEPGGGAAEFWRHEGEELVLVLEGRILLELEGSPPIVLDRGDCAYYEGMRSHRWSNIGDGIARVLSVGTPPTSV